MIQPYISFAHLYLIINAFIGVESGFLSFSTAVSASNGHRYLRCERYSHKNICIFNHERVLIPSFNRKREGALLPSSALETALSFARKNGVAPYACKAALHSAPTKWRCLFCRHLHHERALLPSSEHIWASSYSYTTSALYKMQGVLYFVVRTEMYQE